MTTLITAAKETTINKVDIINRCKMNLYRKSSNKHPGHLFQI